MTINYYIIIKWTFLYNCGDKITLMRINYKKIYIKNHWNNILHHKINKE